MKEIELTHGKVALVDDDMSEELNQFKWWAKKIRNTFYAERHGPKINGKWKRFYMHREVIGDFPKGLMTDHKNGNGLDNQRKNLRLVTRRQNAQNQKNRKQSSQYPGVHWDKTNKKWMAQIVIKGTTKHLGRFPDEKEAFEVYKKAVNNLGETVINK